MLKTFERETIHACETPDVSFIRHRFRYFSLSISLSLHDTLFSFVLFDSSESIFTIAFVLLQEERAQTKYPWNEYEVNLILGSFFWGYICTELPGGRLAEIIGTRRVFGYSMLTSSFITLLTPFTATFGYQVVAALRVVLGFMLVRCYLLKQSLYLAVITVSRSIPANIRDCHFATVI